MSDSEAEQKERGGKKWAGRQACGPFCACRLVFVPVSNVRVSR